MRLTGCIVADPDLDTNENDERNPKYNKKRYDLAASPGIGSATPLMNVSLRTEIKFVSGMQLTSRARSRQIILGTNVMNPRGSRLQNTLIIPSFLRGLPFEGSCRTRMRTKAVTALHGLESVVAITFSVLSYPSGRLIQKHHRQLARSVKAPPI